MVSSVDDLLDELTDQFDYESSSNSDKKKNNKSGSNKQSSSSSSKDSWNPSDILELLNIAPSESDQVEANILTHLFGAKRFFTLDNYTIDNLPRSKLN